MTNSFMTLNNEKNIMHYACMNDMTGVNRIKSNLIDLGLEHFGMSSTRSDDFIQYTLLPGLIDKMSSNILYMRK